RRPRPTQREQGAGDVGGYHEHLRQGSAEGRSQGGLIGQMYRSVFRSTTTAGSLPPSSISTRLPRPGTGEPGSSPYGHSCSLPPPRPSLMHRPTMAGPKGSRLCRIESRRAAGAAATQKGSGERKGAREWAARGKALPEKETAPRLPQLQVLPMLTLFQRNRATAAEWPDAAENGKGLLRPESAASLLATPRRQRLLEHIWQRTSLSRQQFASLYLAPLERYAELVQQFPASESHHHAYLDRKSVV